MKGTDAGEQELDDPLCDVSDLVLMPSEAHKFEIFLVHAFVTGLFVQEVRNLRAKAFNYKVYNRNLLLTLQNFINGVGQPTITAGLSWGLHRVFHRGLRGCGGRSWLLALSQHSGP